MKRYSTSFKEKAVALSYERENIKELAHELGIDSQRIYKWRKSAKAGKLSSIRSNKPKITEDPEVKKWKKAYRDSQQELEILKKAVHIFSKSDGKSINL